MKYIFFCPSYGFGGLEMQMVRRAKEAIERGDTALLITLPGSQMYSYAVELGVPVQSLSIRIEYVDIFSAIRLGHIFRKEQADSCIVGITRHLSIAIAAKKFYGLPVDIVLFQQMISGLKKIDFFHNWVYRNVTRAIVPTVQMADMLSTTTVLPKNKIDIIPYAINLNECDSLNYNAKNEREKFGLPKNAFIIGHTARFELLKDQETAIRAFAAAKLPDAILVLAGEGNPDYRRNMQILASELAVEQSVRFLPFTHDFGALLSCFDVYIMTSLCETFSLALIQAMAAGKPVIGTRSGGTPEAITHGHNGLLFEPRDDKQLSRHLVLLKNNKDFRMKLARQAKRDAESRYDRKKINEVFFRSCTTGINGDFTPVRLVAA